MAEEQQNDKPTTPFERKLGHTINAVFAGLLLWFGSTVISTTTDLTAAKERLRGLENGLNEVKIAIRQGTEDRYTHREAEQALREIRDVQRGHTADIYYVKGIIETCVPTEGK